MANVDLWFKGMGNAVYDLPPVCMKCGAEATVVEKRRFDQRAKGAIVEMPFCFRHVNHNGVLRFISLALKVVVPLCIVVIFGCGLGPLTPDSGAWIYCIWLLAVAIVFWRYWIFRPGLRPTSITEKKIQFAGVSPKFVQAVVEAEAKWLEGLDRELGGRWRDRDCQKSAEEPRYQRARREPPPQATDSSGSEKDEAEP
jgi:hypothetical protein